MIIFNGNILILGCGSVAQCMLPMLLKLIDIDPVKITVMDFIDQRSRITETLKKGVQYTQMRITQENYANVLKKYLRAGDLFIDLSWNVETKALLDWCYDHGVCYLNTSVEEWDPYANAHARQPADLTLYSRQMALREMMSSWRSAKGPTAIVDHGANPGLVSHFVKQALIEIGEKILREKPQDSRCESIREAIETSNFPALAYLEGVKTIHISERDTQITEKPKLFNEFVNTWSIPGFMEEGIAPAEMGWGTHEMFLPPGAILHESGPGNQICLSQKGIKTWVRSWVPSGPMTGMVIRHGEAFSLSEYLTVKQDNALIYRPTVHYAYCPCDAAINSLHEFEMRYFVPQEKERILSDDILAGKDELGCLLMGHDFKAWWIGSVLDIGTARELVPHQNATTVQVAIGVAAAAIYMIEHPQLGFCLPEALDHRAILKIARPYLGQFISKPVDWTPLDHAKAAADYNEKLPSQEEMWQFSTFLVSPKPIQLASLESPGVILAGECKS